LIGVVKMNLYSIDW